MSFKEFTNKVLKLNSSRKHKVTNSYGIKDGYRYYRRTKAYKKTEYIIDEHQYYKITRMVNKLLAESLSEGDDIILPNRMGELELRKKEANIRYKNNKLCTNLPINWYSTLKLWYEDEEAHKNKTLVKVEEKEIYKVHYNRAVANYNNKSFYDFIINKSIRQRLKNNIKEGKIIDAFCFRKR